LIVLGLGLALYLFGGSLRAFQSPGPATAGLLHSFLRLNDVHGGIYREANAARVMLEAAPRSTAVLLAWGE